MTNFDKFFIFVWHSIVTVFALISVGIFLNPDLLPVSFMPWYQGFIADINENGLSEFVRNLVVSYGIFIGLFIIVLSIITVSYSRRKRDELKLKQLDAYEEANVDLIASNKNLVELSNSKTKENRELKSQLEGYVENQMYFDSLKATVENDLIANSGKISGFLKNASDLNNSVGTVSDKIRESSQLKALYKSLDSLSEKVSSIEFNSTGTASTNVDMSSVIGLMDTLKTMTNNLVDQTHEYSLTKTDFLVKKAEYDEKYNQLAIRERNIEEKETDNQNVYDSVDSIVVKLSSKYDDDLEELSSDLKTAKTKYQNLLTSLGEVKGLAFSLKHNNDNSEAIDELNEIVSSIN